MISYANFDASTTSSFGGVGTDRKKKQSLLYLIDPSIVNLTSLGLINNLEI